MEGDSNSAKRGNGRRGVVGLVGAGLGRRWRSHRSGQADLWLGLAVVAVSTVALMVGEYTVEFG